MLIKNIKNYKIHNYLKLRAAFHCTAWPKAFYQKNIFSKKKSAKFLTRRRFKNFLFFICLNFVISEQQSADPASGVFKDFSVLLRVKKKKFKSKPHKFRILWHIFWDKTKYMCKFLVSFLQLRANLRLF